MCSGIRPTTGIWVDLQGPCPTRKLTFSSSNHQLQMPSQLGVGLCSLPIHMENLMGLTSVLCKQSQSTWQHSTLAHCVHQILFLCRCLLLLAVTIFLPLFYDDPRALGWGNVIHNSCLELSILWFLIYCLLTDLDFHINYNLLQKEISLRWGIRNALIYGSKNKNLGDSLILCPCFSVIVLGSPYSL